MIQIAPTMDIDACHALRRTVFIDEQGFSEADEWDDLDAGSDHLLALGGGRALGTARLLRDGDEGWIGRVCVLKEARGTGLGAALIRFGIDHFRQVSGVTCVLLGAQCQALGFYSKLGFTEISPVYDDGGVPHQTMRYTL